MSSDIRWLLEVMLSVTSLPSDHPKVLDLGGGRGGLRKALEQRGYLKVKSPGTCCWQTQSTSSRKNAT